MPPVCIQVHPRLKNVLLSRFHRLFMLVPDKKKCNFPSSGAAASFQDNHRGAEQLSPKTIERLGELESKPSKPALVDHEKSLVSAEHAVVKALQMLDKTCNDLVVQAEREAARQERLDTLKRRQLGKLAATKKEARDAGRHEAFVEAGRSGESVEGSDDGSPKCSGSGSGEEDDDEDKKSTVGSQDETCQHCP